ncbi:MAG: hypothetical protein LBR17_04020 [Bacteroidales bacterium]|jgi:hypothetical protein|nr:hypothetical protein [Bacteroidales bacterium]
MKKQKINQKDIKSKKFCTFVGMKKNKKRNQFLINRFSLFGLGGGLLLLFMFFNGVAKGQVVSTSNINFGLYSIQGNRVGQKIKQWNKNATIALAKDRFYKIQQGKSTTSYVDMPLSVADFAILGDSLYFCGRTGEYGYIGYVKITDLFNGGSCRYSLITTTKDIRRLEVYHNSTNERVVAAIGLQTYAPSPTNLCMTPDPCGYTFYSSVSCDCLIMCKITEQLIDTANYYEVGGTPSNPILPTPSYAPINIVNIFNCYNYNTYTIPLSETFNDITITENYIVLLSTFGSYYYNYNQSLYLRRFDKNNYSQVSKVLRFLYPNECAILEFGFGIEALNNDNIALSYVSNGDISYYHNVFKIDMTTIPFTIIHSSLISDDKAKQYDMEYIPEKDILLVLQDPDEQVNQMIYYVNMDNNVYNNGISYNTNVLDTRQPFNILNNLLNLNLNSVYSHYAIIGRSSSDEMLIIDKDLNNNNLGEFDCYDMMDAKIQQRPNRVFIDWYDLNLCNYGFMANCWSCAIYLPYMSVSTTYRVLINSIQVPSEIDNITEQCITK